MGATPQPSFPTLSPELQHGCLIPVPPLLVQSSLSLAPSLTWYSSSMYTLVLNVILPLLASTMRNSSVTPRGASPGAALLP